MRLIDADALLQSIIDNKIPFGTAETNIDIEVFPNLLLFNYKNEVIITAPIVDAVEVVRCENCKWFGEEDEDGHCWCNFNDISTLKHSFCYFGEKRDIIAAQPTVECFTEREEELIKKEKATPLLVRKEQDGETVEWFYGVNWEITAFWMDDLKGSPTKEEAIQAYKDRCIEVKNEID